MAGLAWIEAVVEAYDLNRDVRPGGRSHQVFQLTQHHAGTARRARQHRFVQNDPELWRAPAFQNLLATHPYIDQLAYSLRLDIEHYGRGGRLGELPSLQQARNYQAAVLVDRLCRLLHADQGAVRRGNLDLLPPSAPATLFGKYQKAGQLSRREAVPVRQPPHVLGAEAASAGVQAGRLWNRYTEVG
jgi:hypothetical protein